MVLSRHPLYGIFCTSAVYCVAVDSVGDAVVGTGVPGELSAPTISGKPAYGQVLTEAHGSWFNTTSGYSYQWQRCNTAGADCVAIPAATTQTYKLTLADAGSTIVVEWTASNAQGTGTAANSSATAVILGVGKANVSKIRSKRPSARRKASRPEANVTATVSCSGNAIQICTGELAITAVEHPAGQEADRNERARAQEAQSAPRRRRRP